MKLPNRKKAFVQKEKLTNYLLSGTHPVGSAKARFFRKIGFNESNVDELRKALLKIALENDVKEERKFEYGINYSVDGIIETPNGKSVTITTVWYAQAAKNRPRFVTAYPV